MGFLDWVYLGLGCLGLGFGFELVGSFMLCLGLCGKWILVFWIFHEQMQIKYIE